MKKHCREIVVGLVLLVAFSLGGIGSNAQSPGTRIVGPDFRSYFPDSTIMRRQMPYRVLLPKSYAESGSALQKYPVLYLLHGLGGNFTNWGDKTELGKFAEKYELIIIMPDGGNGWYSDSVSTPNDKYESYIIQELLPEIDRRYRTAPNRENSFIAGLSMGGYGALKFGLKYPEKFSLVGSFSGALGAASFTEKGAGNIGKSIEAILGAEGSETRKSNEIFGLIREMDAAKIKTLPFIYLSCGTEDFLIQNNRDYLALLNEKKVPHEYRERPGAHSWPFWDDQVREFLSVVERRLAK